MKAAVAAAAAMVALSFPHAAQADDRSDALAALPDTAWQKSITQLTSEVHQLKAPPAPLERSRNDGGENVISLSSDILFPFDSDDLSAQAKGRIGELLKKVPSGRPVKISGYTDSVGAADYNKGLSERRAQSVAAVVRGARADLTLTVAGFGAADPVAPNDSAGKDNPAGRALNRRVDLSFAS